MVARILGAMVLGALFVLSAALASAQESTITFPVAELGNCTSKSECHAYCDNLANIKKCVAFAESHGLMSAEEARQAREFERLGGKGPGGCTSKDSCESFCEKPGNMRQCLDFAKKSGMMNAEELQEAEKVAAYLDKGGTMPGECRGEKECRAYCEDGAHAEECVAFATKAGFMSEKEAEMFKKTGGKGPGGCKGRACESYCQDESHREACIAFALEHDLMSDEDKQRMEEGREKAKQALEKAPPKVLECIEARIGGERLKAIRDGSGFMDQRLGEILPACFREVMGDGSQGGPFGPGSAATECMRKVFGEDFEEKMRKGELDPGARDNEIRECMIEQRGEGFLDEKGQWERPQTGEAPREGERGRPPEGMQFGPREDGDREGIEAQMRARYGEEFDSQRRVMEERMRAEIEAQMRSGNFDMSKLPPDFRPEGAFPPPEAYNRPPDGSMPPSGDFQPPTEGMMPPPEGTAPPPMEFAPPPATSREPVSMRDQFVANIITIFQNLLIGR
ncbi:hypothetical protein A3D72_04680 [Candidatus Uhrbacteria bacterium RIFCSPHIGHO2_02_FULL_57_19]|uniref:Uncharacterized protein n=1 Tax=Candidatus Uhrbacteria bacterium RIFCSPHIGHO2_02_FULL_57_19 TaxID=1802391 RepID=A0A1F7U3T5_9BACT|nr:MAG: hypothetical protein A3D72_04680 [Candidatus Uhrbacteria bacterium RIFCSPHIGHO2_02_FULL_57_19]